MLLNAIQVNEDVVNALSDRLSTILGKGEDAVFNSALPECPDLQVIERIYEKFGNEARRLVDVGLVEKVVSRVIELFAIIQELPDIEESFDIIKSLIDSIDFGKCVIEQASNVGEKKLVQATSKIDKNKLSQLSKRAAELIITSRDAVRVFQEVSAGKLFKDKMAILLMYCIHRLLKGTRFELGNVLSLPAHVDIHLIKVLLRVGVLVINPEVLEKYAGAGRYRVRIVPVCARLAPDEPFKTLWDVLRRHSLTVLKVLCERLEAPQLLIGEYLSAIGKRICIFNDDSVASPHLCPVKDLRQCPLAVVCRAYAGLQNVRIFSRRQARLLLRFFGVSPRRAEDVECELIVI